MDWAYIRKVLAFGMYLLLENARFRKVLVLSKVRSSHLSAPVTCLVHSAHLSHVYVCVYVYVSVYVYVYVYVYVDVYACPHCRSLDEGARI